MEIVGLVPQRKEVPTMENRPLSCHRCRLSFCTFSGCSESENGYREPKYRLEGCSRAVTARFCFSIALVSHPTHHWCSCQPRYAYVVKRSHHGTLPGKGCMTSTMKVFGHSYCANLSFQITKMISLHPVVMHYSLVFLLLSRSSQTTSVRTSLIHVL